MKEHNFIISIVYIEKRYRCNMFGITGLRVEKSEQKQTQTPCTKKIFTYSLKRCINSL